MADKELSLNELAKLEGNEVDREWAKISSGDHAFEIINYFKNLKTAVSVDPNVSFHKTISWARVKLEKLKKSLLKKNKKEISVSEYLRKTAISVYENELVEAVKAGGNEGVLAWKEIENKLLDNVFQRLKKFHDCNFADDDAFRKDAGTRCHARIIEGGYRPEERDVQDFLESVVWIDVGKRFSGQIKAYFIRRLKEKKIFH